MACCPTGRPGWSSRCGVADVRREPSRLGDGPFDLLVIGGGIYGAWIAYDAALRGLSVALVEAEDWGSGTSSASSKLIHGGLRYLEHGHLGLVAKSLRERSRLLRLAPHRVWPLRFLLPLWDDSRMGALALGAGLWAYDLLAGADNGGCPRHQRLGVDDLAATAGFLAGGLRAGFAYGDAGTDDARLVLELVSGALSAGAVAVNHVRATALRSAGSGVEGAEVIDLLSQRTWSVRARMTVVAGGACSTMLNGVEGPRPPLRYSKGVHLLLPPLPLIAPTQSAMLLTAPRDGRVFFLIPWYGATLVGTTDTEHPGPPAPVTVDDADIDYLLAAVAVRCPGLGWGRKQVRGSFAGLRVLVGGDGRAIGAVSREWTLAEPRAGLLLPLGGKLTSARVEADRTVQRIFALGGRRAPGCPTADRLLPWAPAEPWSLWAERRIAEGVALGLDHEVCATAVRRYGTTIEWLFARLRSDPAGCRRASRRVPFCRAESAHAVEHEMAVIGEDIVRRRVPLALLGGGAVE